MSIEMGGTAKVITQAYVDDISRGLITGKEDFNKFGKNDDVGTVIEDVWLTGGTRTYLSAAELLTIVSSDIADDGDPVGTGARTVTIYGLNDSYERVEETVTMDGTTAVTLTVPMFRPYRMKVITSGTDLSNKGIITLKNNAGTVTLGTIGAYDGQTLMTHFTVPAGKRLLLKNLTFSATGGKDITAELFVRPFGESWQVKLAATLNNSPFVRIFDPPFVVDAKSDIVVRAISVQAGGIINAGWDSVLEST